MILSWKIIVGAKNQDRIILSETYRKPANHLLFLKVDQPLKFYSMATKVKKFPKPLRQQLEKM